MKNLVVIVLFLIGFQVSSQAQADLQINPISLLFGAFQVSAEFPVSKSGGIEVNMIGADGGFGIIGIGKYYMNPRYGADRFYIGGFAGTLFEEGAGLGFLAGQKWLSEQGVSFELALGIGRGTGDIEVFPYGKLAVGYRFGKK